MTENIEIPLNVNEIKKEECDSSDEGKVYPTTGLTHQSSASTSKQNVIKLLIPKEYIPKLSQRNGPLIIKVPGFTPLITNSTSSNTSTISTATKKIIEPNFLNLAKMKISKKLAAGHCENLAPKIDPLTNRKFCWISIKNRKRDLDGLTFQDPIGFGPADLQRARHCCNILHTLISMREFNLKELQHNSAWRAFNNTVDSDKKRKRKPARRTLVSQFRRYTPPRQTLTKLIEAPVEDKQQKQDEETSPNSTTRKRIIKKPNVLDFIYPRLKKSPQKIENPVNVKSEQIPDQELENQKRVFVENVFKLKFKTVLEGFKIASDKPLLMVNEENLENWSYDDPVLFNDNTVICVVTNNKIEPYVNFMLKSFSFDSAVRMNMIQIVDNNVLCRYIAAEIAESMKEGRKSRFTNTDFIS